MPKVLHVGPCESPGGMANVMRILADHPPEGWQAELLSSHVNGSPWAKWRAYRTARKALIQMLNDETERPDIVHVHTAADWSWRRKRRFVQLAHQAGVPNIVHIHSGQFDLWLGTPESKRSRTLNAFLKANQSHTIVLGDGWKKRLEPFLGTVHPMNNPVDSGIQSGELERDKSHLLLLGRNDAVKGHQFAIKVCEKVREEFPELNVTMTGISSSPHEWLSAQGWVSESDKKHLLQTASLLLVPSTYEGQPLVILEALTCGLPVLASDRIISPEGIKSAPYQDVEAWVSSICDALNSSDMNTSKTIPIDVFKTEYVSQQWGIFYSNCLEQ